MEIRKTDSTDPDFITLVNALDAELRIRNGEADSFYKQFNKIDTIRHCVVLSEDGKPMACGAFKHFEAGAVEIKRMYVLPEARKNGLAQRVLQSLENWAAETGMKACVLETGLNLPEAIRLYENAGYTRIPNYGQYIGIANSVCYKKVLT